MSDMEKVINTLQEIKTQTSGIELDSAVIAHEFIDKIIDLLKEQEAVAPIPYHRSDGTIFKYECRQCRTKIFKMDLFCRRCGRAVKWNE